MQKNKNKLNVYPNGATVRMHNRKISLIGNDDKIMIQFLFADENPNKPACSHKCHKGKVRETFIQLNIESMDALVNAYMQYTIEKSKQELKENP